MRALRFLHGHLSDLPWFSRRTRQSARRIYLIKEHARKRTVRQTARRSPYRPLYLVSFLPDHLSLGVDYTASCRPRPRPYREDVQAAFKDRLAAPSLPPLFLIRPVPAGARGCGLARPLAGLLKRFPFLRTFGVMLDLAPSAMPDRGGKRRSTRKGHATRPRRASDRLRSRCCGRKSTMRHPLLTAKESSRSFRRERAVAGALVHTWTG